jgi:hypothetical protein
MKTLITKADGTPTKSKVHALQQLEKMGIDKDLLIEENGSFYYVSEDTEGEVKAEVKPAKAPKAEVKLDKELTWNTPVLPDGNNYTKLAFKGNDIVDVTFLAKHPQGQTAQRPYNAIEVSIDGHRVILPFEICQKILEVKGV